MSLTEHTVSFRDAQSLESDFKGIWIPLISTTHEHRSETQRGVKDTDNRCGCDSCYCAFGDRLLGVPQVTRPVRSCHYSFETINRHTHTSYKNMISGGWGGEWLEHWWRMCPAKIISPHRTLARHSRLIFKMCQMTPGINSRTYQ